MMRRRAARSRGRSTKYVRLDARKCTACWECVSECKYGALGRLNLWFHKHVVIKDSDKCRGCKRCIAICPKGAFAAVTQNATP